MPPRVLLNAAGLTISKPTIDVLTATDQNNLSFSSSFKGFGVAQTGTLSLTAPGGTLTFPARASPPLVLFMFNQGSQWWNFFGTVGGEATVGANTSSGITFVYTNSTTITISTSRTTTVRYYFFYQS